MASPQSNLTPATDPPPVSTDSSILARTRILEPGPGGNSAESITPPGTMPAGGKIGPYTITGFVGRGGMALVYSAVDPDGDPVALKVMEETVFLPATILARFRREADAAKRLRRHPHVVTVYDTGHVGRSHYIAMELVPGGHTLEKVLATSLLPLPQALKIGTAIAQALSYAHDQGVIHRDLKPGNILMTDFHEPLLADFGLARMEFEDSHNLTISSMSMGTPRYMAPEQTLSAKKTGVPTDIYSFGVLLFELLTGKPPYDIPAQVPMVEMFEIIRHSRPRNARKLRPGIPKDIAALLQKLLEKDPEDRYRSMRDVLLDLEAHQAGGRVSVRVPNLFERCDRVIRRHKVAAFALTAASTLLFTVWQRYERKLGGQWEEQAVERAQLNSQSARLAELLGETSDGGAASQDERLLKKAWKALTDDHDVEQAEAILLALERRISAQTEPSPPGEADYAEAVQLTSRYRHLASLRSATAQRELGRLALARGDYRAARGVFRSLSGRKELPDAYRQLSSFEAGLAAWLAGDREKARNVWRGLALELAREALAPSRPQEADAVDGFLAMFLSALSSRLPKGNTSVTMVWQESLRTTSIPAVRELAGDADASCRNLEQGIGLLCLGGLGWLPAHELAMEARDNPSIIRSLAFWLAAEQTSEPADRLRFLREAKTTAKDALPWLYYVVETTLPTSPAAQRPQRPNSSQETERQTDP